MAVTPQQHAQKIMSLMNAGQFAQAAKAAKAATKKFPQDGNFANVAGMALAQSGKPREAVAFFNKALSTNPSEAGFQDNLIQALVLTDQFRKAEDLISKLIPKRANPAQLYHFRASAYQRQGLPDKVVEAATKAVEANPKLALSYNIRGIAHTDLGNYDAAVADFRKSHEINPKDPDPLANIGLPLSRMDRTKEAMEAVEHALALHPNHINALHRYAIQLAEVGRIDEAVDQYHRLLKVDPSHGEAYSELVGTQSKEQNAVLEPTLRAAIAKLPQKAPAQVFLKLALGNLLYQSGVYDEASKFLALSNRMSAQQRPFDRGAAEHGFERTLQLFSESHPVPMSGDSDLPRPIFIVGQPRSGTTLTEMMLGAHPEVQSCGELASAGRIAEPILLDKSKFDPAEFARKYRSLLPSLAPDATYFVDKMPANYRYIGFLLHAFPDALIIHVERDPRDVALSMWRSHFPAAWMNFTFDLKAMAFQANLYRRYMNHWSGLFGDRILSVNYDQIVSEIDATSQQIASFCKLDWISEMSSPELTKAHVRTASVVQVRQGVHSKSVGGWRRMQETLQPFVDGLNSDLWPELALESAAQP